MTLPEYWGEELVWWHGRTSFKGQVIAPACTLAMEDTWQVIDMGETPVRDLQDSTAVPEKKFRLRLRNCELAGTGKRIYTASRVRMTFDGLRGETPDKFSLLGEAERFQSADTEQSRLSGSCWKSYAAAIIERK